MRMKERLGLKGYINSDQKNDALDFNQVHCQMDLRLKISTPSRPTGSSPVSRNPGFKGWAKTNVPSSRSWFSRDKISAKFICERPGPCKCSVLRISNINRRESRKLYSPPTIRSTLL